MGKKGNNKGSANAKGTIRKCLFCDDEFNATQYNSKYCSDSHKQQDYESRKKKEFVSVFKGTKEELMAFLPLPAKYRNDAPLSKFMNGINFLEIKKIIEAKAINESWFFETGDFRLDFVPHIQKRPYELFLQEKENRNSIFFKIKDESALPTKISQMFLPSLSELLKLKNDVSETKKIAEIVLDAKKNESELLTKKDESDTSTKKIELDEVLEKIEKNLQKLDSQLHSFESQNSERIMSAIATAKTFSDSDANPTMQHPRQAMSKPTLFLKENIYSGKPIIGNLASYHASPGILASTGRNSGFIPFLIGFGLGVFICYVFPEIISKNRLQQNVA